MLFICEKPSQAKDIARVLAHGSARQMDGYIVAGPSKVTWCVGHFLEMAMPEEYDASLKSWTIESLPILPDQWKMGVKRGMGKQFGIVKRLLKQSRHTVIATDADREGEVIAREVLDMVQYRGKLQRLWLSSLDDASIKHALDHMRDGKETESLYEAGLGRARSDWLVGMNLTRAYTCLGREAGYDGLLSIGRVQTPTLALVVERDLAIERFEPQNYYKVRVSLAHDGCTFDAYWQASEGEHGAMLDAQGRCTSEQSALQVSQSLSQSMALVQTREVKRKTQAAPLVFSLSALQKSASAKWGYGAKQTLEIAQALYEKYKATSYPRSDCRYLPLEQYAEAREVIEALESVFVQEPVLSKQIAAVDISIRGRVWNSAKITAHHGIIPTRNARITLSKMSDSERNIYTLIVQHYLAQFYSPYLHEQTEIKLVSGSLMLLAKGDRPIQQGWRNVLSASDQTDKPENTLPMVKEGDQIPITDTDVLTCQTKAPPRYSEGTLIDAMANIARYVEDTEAKKILKENEGIGTEATRAGIIETLKKRKYVQRKGKQIIASQVGRDLIRTLPNELTDPVMTALMERLLSKIAKGEIGLENYMQRQAQYVSSLVDIAKSGNISLSTAQKSPVISSTESTVQHCPKCESALVRRKGKKGYFLGCSSYPDCNHTAFLN